MCVCNQPRDLSRLSSCKHENADTRIILNMEDAVKEGYTKVTIRTVDTDVVVLAVASAQRHKSTEVWVADRCIALPVFHAFTGCDSLVFWRQE